MKKHGTAKRLLCMIICIVLMLPDLAFGIGVDDVKGHWAEPQVREWINKGYIKSYGDGSFKPDNPVTRAEFMAIVNRSFGFSDNSAQLDYIDVKSADWFYEDVAKAVKAGYIGGIGNKRMLPEGNITNQEVAVVITKLLKLNAPTAFDLTASFTDSADIPQWSLNAIKAVVGNGYMKGYADKTFRPQKPITRAEVVAILDSCYLKHEKKAIYKAGEYSEGTIEGSLLINTRGVTLKDTVINGDLILGEAIGDGEVHLKNITVKGETIVKGGGMDSVYIEDSNLTHIIIIKVGNKVRVVAMGSTNIGAVSVQSGAKLEEQALTGEGFGMVTIAEMDAEDASIILSGSFQSVQVMADGVDINLLHGNIGNLNITPRGEGSNINIASGASVSNLLLDAPVNVTGEGRIQNAQVNAPGSTLGIQPAAVSNPGGAGITINPPTPPSSATGGSSSGGGGGGGGGGGSHDDGDTTPGSAAITPDQQLVEVTLDDRKLTVTLTNDSFRDSILNPAYFVLNNKPAGLSVESVQYINSVKAELKLAFDMTDFDSNINNFSVTVLGNELNKGISLTSNSLVISANAVDDTTSPTIKAFTQLSSNSVKLEFDERLNRASAETLDNYVLNGGIGKASKASLHSDGKTVTLEFPCQMSKNKVYKLSVGNVTDLSHNSCSFVRNFVSIYEVPEELMPPHVASIHEISLNTLEIVFSDTLDEASAETPLNYEINNGIGNPLNASLGEDGKTVTLTIPTMKVNYIYTITLSNLADNDGNRMATTDIKFYTIADVNDITAPEIDDIEAPFGNELRVTFSEEIEAQPGARIVVSFGDSPQYADFVWTGTAILGGGTTAVFKANRHMAPGENKEQFGSFSGADFALNSIRYTVEGVQGVQDIAGNLCDLDIDNKPEFYGSTAVNDKPKIISIEQTDAATIKLVFSEPVLSPGGHIISKDVTNTEFSLSDADPEDEGIDKGYSTIKLSAEHALVNGNTYSFDLSAVSGLSDYCGTPVRDENDTADNSSGYTDFTAHFMDTEAPYIEKIEVTGGRAVSIYYNEPLMSPGVYEITYNQGDIEHHMKSTASLYPTNNTVRLLVSENLSSSIIYTLVPVEGAKDLSMNEAVTEGESNEFVGTDSVVEYIKRINVINGQRIKIYLSSYTGGTDSISVVDAVYIEQELCNQLIVEESIGYTGTTKEVTVTTQPLMHDREYIVTIGDSSVGSADLSKPVSYEFEGIVDDGDIEIDEKDVIFIDIDVMRIAVYIVAGSERQLVIPDSPTSEFDATDTLNSLGNPSHFKIEVYILTKEQDTSGGNWVGEYGEYSDTNPSGFIQGPIIYIKEL